MDRDEEESNDPNGQRMRDAFALADLFVNIDYKDATEKLMRRFLEAQFGSNKISPTREEYGMYLAKTASLRSVDLSRQVGAAIMSPLGEIISLGCNEVPSPGGGTYWSDSSPDHRDFVKGLDENERIKRALLVDIVKRLTDSGLIQSTLSDVELRQKVLDHSMTKGSPVRDALLMDLLEFGRVIHAEMCALCDSARLGRSVKNSRLFCTTFPCHMCAKHIIAAGIMDVYYVEPYPKSYAEQLHSDAIVVTTKDDEHETRVRFHPFVGIAPHRYRDLFERGKRKGDSGDFAEWLLEAGGKPKPTFRFTVASYLDNELAFARLLEDRTKVLTANGLVRVERASESGE
jgi:cytidine deaminase